MIIVEAEGLNCPFPVIEAKKALRDAGEENVLVKVDNEVAVGNLQRLAESMGKESSVEQISDELYEVTIAAGGEGGEEVEAEDVVSCPSVPVSSDYVVQISSRCMGHGNDELGAVLIKSFIYSLSEQDVLPKAIVFYNTGVELTCKGSPVLEDLHKLMDAGVDIISCGTCLDFLDLKDDLELGSIGNMYSIVELLRQYRTLAP